MPYRHVARKSLGALPARKSLGALPAPLKLNPTGGCNPKCSSDSETTEESESEFESEPEKEMAKALRKCKRSRTSGAANENHSESQKYTDSSNSGGPAVAPIINDNQPSTSSNATIAQLQKENGIFLGLLNAKNEEIQMITKLLTENKAQSGAENERLKKEILKLRNRLADN